MCLSFGGSRRTVTAATFTTIKNLRPRTTVLCATYSETPASSPGAWTNFTGGAFPGGSFSVGEWLQIVTDQPGAGRLGFGTDWAYSHAGDAIRGVYTYFVPGSSSGWYRVWPSGSVPYGDTNLGINRPTRVWYADRLNNCHIKIDGVDCLGMLIRAVGCTGCRFTISNVLARQQESWGDDVAAVQEDGGSGNTFEFTNCDSPGAFFRSDRADGTRIIGSDVNGCSMVGDMGVVYIGGRDSMTRRAVISGEFNVKTLETNLVMGANVRSRIYLDDFSYGHRIGPLTLTADDGDYDVNIGGGSAITVTTAGTHLNENRDAFSSEYAAWFPGVDPATGLAGVVGPRSNTGQNTIAA